MTNLPRIIAHRGSSLAAPENTFAAFEQAVNDGADGIEFDVHLAKDGVPVVIHDDDLSRTGLRKGSVSEMTSSELSAVDVGSWFNKKFPALKDHSAERIHTLSETLELLKDFNGSIFIELKCGRNEVQPLVLAVCNIAAAARLSWQIIIKSFDPSVVPLVKMAAPNIRAFCLFDISIMNMLRRRSDIPQLAYQLGADGISLHRGLVNKALLAVANRLALSVAVWTVDDPKWVKRSAELRITYLITNDPAKLLAKRKALRLSRQAQN